MRDVNKGSMGMKKINMLLLAMAGSALMAAAADHSMTNNNAAGKSSYNSGIDWDDGQAPAPANHYFTAGKVMRTPETGSVVSNVHVFAGDSLTLNGGTMAWKSLGLLLITNLVADGGNLQQWRDSSTARLDGKITVKNGKTLTINANEPNRREFEIYSDIHGGGDIEIQMNQVATLKQTRFFGNNTNFTGQIRLRGQGKFGICAEEALGSNPAGFTANKLDFGGTTLIITNSLTLDDPNRGLNLNTLNTGLNAPGGVFEVTGSAVAEIACRISGAGPLTKRGSGTLLLATNEAYTGVTTVEAGTLQLAAGASLQTSGILVTGATAVVVGAALPGVTLSAGGTLAAAGAGCDVSNLTIQEGWLALDLSGADPATTLVRVSGALNLGVYQVIKLTVNTNNTTESAYQVLSAPNLGDFADHDFCLDKPWTGELSRMDDGLGGQVLLFTPTPPEKIVYKTDSDPLNTTGFLRSDCWSDGLAPTNEPTGVKTYVMETREMRTPYNQSLTFGGKRLVQNTISMALKGTSSIPTIADLTVMNDASFGMADAPRVSMAGNIWMHPLMGAGKIYALRIAGSNSGRDMHLYAQLNGYGDLLLQDLGNPAYSSSIHNLYADNTNYFGKIRVNGHSNFWLRVTHEQKMGGEPPVFRADQLSFNGGGISVTNDVTLDDSGRGITLLPDGGYLTMNTNPGAFTNGTPAAERWYAGGATLRAEGAATLTIGCPVAGGGGLTKAGSGTLELGGSNSYTGLTAIVEGGLFPAAADALGTGPVKVSGAGRLLCRYSGSMLTNGVELGGRIEFASGGAVRVELAEGASQPTGTFAVPLFLLPAGESITAQEVPLEHTLVNVSAQVVISTVGSQTLVSAEFASTAGTLIMVR